MEYNGVSDAGREGSVDAVMDQSSRRTHVLQLCCLVALWANVFGTWATNAFLYPQYISILPEARDISSVVGVATLVLLAFWALRHPASLHDDRLTIGSLCLYGLGIAFILVGLWEGSALYLAIGAILRSIGSRWFMVLMGISFCQLSGRACMLCIAGAYALDYAVRPLALLCPSTLVLLLVFACPLITLLAIRPYGHEMVEYARTSEAPIHASVTEPASFVSLFSTFFFAIFFFRIAYGFALSFETVDGVPQQTLLSVLPILLVLALVWKPRLPKADILYMASCLLIIAGFLLVLVFRSDSGTSFASLANGCLFVGSECFEMLVLFTLAAIGARNKTNAIAVFAWGRAASSFGLLTGVTVGHTIADIPSVTTGTLVVAGVFFLFVAFNLMVLKGFSFQDTIDGIRPLVPVKAVEGDTRFVSKGERTAVTLGAQSDGEIEPGRECAIKTGADLSCEGKEKVYSHEISERELPVASGAFSDVDPLTMQAQQVAAACNLTPRETEILTLLAHGRNAAFLQQKLVLSRNTIKTHVANIYAKLGVHSQQELIDLVEEAHDGNE